MENNWLYWKPLAWVTVIVVGAVGLWQYKRRQKILPLKHYKDGVLYLHMFYRSCTKKCINLSPYAIKLETWCRMNKVPYEAVETSKFSPREQQIPYVVYNGQVMADSSTILDMLQTTFERYDDLTESQLGVDRAVSRMLDDGFSGLYFLYRYYIKGNEFLKYFRPVGAPKPLQWFIATLIGRGIRSRSLNCGYGRYGNDHVITMGKRDLKALDNILGDQKFMFGDTPTALDATVFGHMCQILYPDLSYPWKDYIRTECPRLEDHCNRMRDTYWPEWDSLVDHDTFH